MKKRVLKGQHWREKDPRAQGRVIELLRKTKKETRFGMELAWVVQRVVQHSLGHSLSGRKTIVLEGSLRERFECLGWGGLAR